MKKISLLVVALLFANAALPADPAKLAWEQVNIETLRSFDKGAVVGFLNELRRSASIPEPLVPGEVGQFDWADLAGDGKYRLVFTTAGPCAHFVTIMTKDSAGQVSSQSIEGVADLKTGIRDLRGNGKEELLVGRLLVQYDCASTFFWPAVYRLENGKYVEASRDFSDFYDNQVLPKLEKQLSEAQMKGRADQAAVAQMTRDKILRVLGRNATAGLEQAYQWMNSDDPYLLQDAELTFLEIGGHEAEARAAHQGWEFKFCARYPGTAMCKSTARQEKN